MVPVGLPSSALVFWTHGLVRFPDSPRCPSGAFKDPNLNEHAHVPERIGACGYVLDHSFCIHLIVPIANSQQGIPLSVE